VKRLPTTEELQETADEVSKQLSTLSVYDFDKVLALLDVAIWECEQDALLNLDRPLTHLDHKSYYAGGLFHLKRLREGLRLAKDAKPRQTE
jgi:hypothetical protein